MSSSQTDEGSIRGDPRTAVFVGILVVVALVIASATGLILWHARVDPYRRADAASQDVLQAISKDLDHSIGFSDVSLRWAISALSTPGFAQASEPVRRQMLFAGDLATQSLGQVLIADSTGRVRYESGAAVPDIANIAGEPYFRTLRDTPLLETLLSRPFEAADGGGMSIALARRFVDADDQFAGVAVSIIPLRSIRELIHTVAAGTNNAVAVLNDDLLVIAREPWDDGVIGRNVQAGPLSALLQHAPSGAFDTTSSLDGVVRHYRYARIGDLPLILVVGSPIEDIYRGWWDEALAMGGVTAVTIGLLLGLARALHVELARRRRAERLAQDGAEQFRMLAENVSDIIVRLDLDGVRSYVSPSIREVLGYTPEELLKSGPWLNVVHPEDRPIAAEALEALRGGKDRMTVVYRAMKKTGGEVWLEAHIRLLRDAETGAPCEMIAVTRDVTSRYASEQELRRLAATDGLTGLANRRTFDAMLDKEWRRATRAEERVALLMMDADYFKLYNDRYGHPAGGRGPADDRRLYCRLHPPSRRSGGPLRRRGVRRAAARHRPGRGGADRRTHSPGYRGDRLAAQRFADGARDHQCRRRLHADEDGRRP